MRSANRRAKTAGDQKQETKVIRALLGTSAISANPTIVPAAPGWSVIGLMPLSDGNFDRERVLKEPVIAWRVQASGYAEPIIPGLPVTDRWAVLTPEGLVVTDQYSNLFGEAPMGLKEWMHFERERLESENGGPLVEFPTACRRVFEYGGPLAKAVGAMMAGRREWVGTPDEMLNALSEFRGDAPDSAWPSGPVGLIVALQQLETKLAIADLFFTPIGNGRLLVNRVGSGAEQNVSRC